MLVLKFLLLRFDMLLGLLISNIGVLHMIADCIASYAAECAAYKSASSRRSYGSTYNCAPNGSDSGAAERAFLTGREWLAGASGDGGNCRQCQCCH